MCDFHWTGGWHRWQPSVGITCRSYQISSKSIKKQNVCTKIQLPLPCSRNSSLFDKFVKSSAADTTSQANGGGATNGITFLTSQRTPSNQVFAQKNAIFFLSCTEGRQVPEIRCSEQNCTASHAADTDKLKISHKVQSKDTTHQSTRSTCSYGFPLQKHNTLTGLYC